jgi:transposase
VYEAGFCGFWIHDELERSGIKCTIVNPADVPTKHKEQVTKTDRVDARKLARGLRNGEFESIYVPSRDALEDRSLVRARLQFIRKQTRCKNQIKSLLYFYGITLPEDTNRYWSNRFITWLEQVRMEQASGDQTLKLLLEELHHLRETIASLTKQIRVLALSNKYCESVQYLHSIPGISSLTAMTLLTELVDINRFESVDKLASYVGIVPGQHSSGEQEIITGLITRRNAFLKYVLIESAWVAVKKDPALILTFNKLTHRMPKNKAIVRIARKLLSRIMFVVKHKQSYQLGMVA